MRKLCIEPVLWVPIAIAISGCATSRVAYRVDDYHKEPENCIASNQTEYCITRDQLLKVIEANRDDMKACYEPVAKAGVQGRATLYLQVDEYGTVKDLAMKQGLNPGFDNCLLGKAKSWVFTNRADSITREIYYPMVFRLQSK